MHIYIYSGESTNSSAPGSHGLREQGSSGKVYICMYVGIY